MYHGEKTAHGLGHRFTLKGVDGGLWENIVVKIREDMTEEPRFEVMFKSSGILILFRIHLKELYLVTLSL